MQFPSAQVSTVVQASPSSQARFSWGIGFFTQTKEEVPIDAQMPVLQLSLLAEQSGFGPGSQSPALQRSPTVHPFESALQSVPSAWSVGSHSPIKSLQVTAVSHWPGARQLIGVPAQLPWSSHWSLVVHAFPSSQASPKARKQSWISSRVGQSAPPCCGSIVTVRDRVCDPEQESSRLVQVPHSPQALTSQSMGQGCSLHACVSVKGSGQAAPPQDAGVVTVKSRDWVPPPHSTLQVPHSDQVPTQSTGTLVPAQLP